MAENVAGPSTAPGSVLLATGGYDNVINLWDVNTGVISGNLLHAESQVNALDISRDRKILAAAGYRRIYLYDINSKNQNPDLMYDGMSNNVTDVGFHEEGKWIYTCGEDGTARIWDLRCARNQYNRICKSNVTINSICLHPNQQELIFGDENGILHFWDIRQDETKKLKPEDNTNIQSVAIDPSAHYVASVNKNGNCYVWETNDTDTDPVKLGPARKMGVHTKYALHCKFSPNSKYLATSSADQTACIWRTNDLSLKQQLKNEKQRWVWRTAFTNDSEHLLTVSTDSTPKIWNIETGNIVRQFATQGKGHTAMAFYDPCSKT